mgnify:FL=1
MTLAAPLRCPPRPFLVQGTVGGKLESVGTCQMLPTLSSPLVYTQHLLYGGGNWTTVTLMVLLSHLANPISIIRCARIVDYSIAPRLNTTNNTLENP